jgi:tetratricopeptide (TPR) repeat protein
MSRRSEPELRECASCGAKSAWQHGFVDATGLFRRGRTLCVTCWRYDRTYRGFYVRCAFWAAVVLFAGYHVTESAAGAALFALDLYACSYVAVVLHELGHALAAVAVGFRVAALSIGGGTRTKAFALRNLFLLVGASPLEGLVLPRPPSTRHYRKKMALVLVAGTAVNVLCAAGTWYLLDPGALGDTARGLAALWIAANLAMALNLLPIVSRGALGTLRSDGLQLLELRKMSDDQVEQRVRNAAFVEAYVAFHCNDPERAYAALAPALAAGELDGSRVLATAILFASGRGRDAADLARRCLAADGHTLDEQGMLMNNLACALLDPRADGPSAADIAEADTLSARAMELIPMANAVRATRGGVLVELGRYEEAAALLADKRFRLEPPWNRASVQANLARALAGLGQRERAAAALRTAARLAPGHPHVERARQWVAARAAGPNVAA